MRQQGVNDDEALGGEVLLSLTVAKLTNHAGAEGWGAGVFAKHLTTELRKANVIPSSTADSDVCAAIERATSQVLLDAASRC